MTHLQQKAFIIAYMYSENCGVGSQWGDWAMWPVLRVFSIRGEQHSSECDRDDGQRKQADQKGENCSSLGMTERE